MNREVHVRFWESPEVKVLRATRQTEPPSFVAAAAARINKERAMRRQTQMAMGAAQGDRRHGA
jgi:hypothetical protein